MTPAIVELERHGIGFTVHEYERGIQLRDFGLEAAERLGLDPDTVFKTLLVVADGAPAVAIVPVSGRLVPKAMARALGAKKVVMCDPRDAERITGYVRGGISPLGQKQRLPTVVDEMATAFDRIYVSGGKRGLDVCVAVDDLVRLTGATVAGIT